MSCFTGVKEEHRISLTWDLDIDVNDTSTDITLPAETRFGGKWFLQAKVTAPLTLELLFKWEDVELGAIGGDFKPEGKFGWIGEADKSTPNCRGSATMHSPINLLPVCPTYSLPSTSPSRSTVGIASN